MKGIKLKWSNVILATTLGFVTAAPSWADKPSWAGEGKGEKHERKHNNKDRDEERSSKGDRGDGRIEIRFGGDYRQTVREYYTQQSQGGKCPPGLAKKNNGCMPPGQAKKWQRGHTLPRDVVMYDLPPDLVIRLGLPPAGHRYVRVAADILLIAAGTNMVVDAIADLGH